MNKFLPTFLLFAATVLCDIGIRAVHRGDIYLAAVDFIASLFWFYAAVATMPTKE